MKGYGQFCPVAKGAEVFAERWTPLVLRELLCGSTHFSDLHRGVPLMSRSLLSLRLKQLEQIVHPMLGAGRKKFFDDAERAGLPVVVVDVPLLYETGGEKRVDAVVVVTTSPELQRERVLARGTMDAAKLDSIIARQTPDAEKRRRADFVVDTSHGLDPVRAQIKDILAAVVKMPQRRA